jgi:hypothetical protein
MKKLLLSAVVALPLFASAQEPSRHHEIGLSVGVSTFYGDLQPNYIPEDNKLMKPSFGILYKYFLNNHFGVRFGANYLHLTAADSLSLNKTYEHRNLSFTNRMGEVYGAIELNLLPIGGESRFKFTPYIFAGVGAFYSNPFAYDAKGEKHYLRDLATEGQGLPNYPDRKVYPMVNATFPIGAGFKFFIGKTVMLTGELNLRYTSTDYIDDVSKTYVNLDTLNHYKGMKAVEMAYRTPEYYGWDGKTYPDYKNQRGDFKGNDWYWTAGITATIYFDSFGNAKRYLQSRCPRIFGIGR